MERKLTLEEEIECAALKTVSIPSMAYLIKILGKGQVNDELTEDLHELVKAVRDAGTPGVLKIELKVVMDSTRDENAIAIKPTKTILWPKTNMQGSILFSTYNGDLLEDDPKQPGLFTDFNKTL